MDPLVQEDVHRIIDALRKEFLCFGGKTILITGANGFVPSYFVDTILILNDTLLRDHPARVIIVSRRAPEEHFRLLHTIQNSQVVFYRHDIRYPIQEFHEHVDYVIHAASKASPKEYLTDPLETVDTNVMGTRHLFEYLHQQERVEGFLFLSSGETYGDPDPVHIPISEAYFGNVDPLGPRAAYQESKRFGETLTALYGKQYQIPVKIVRLFHTYGPRMMLTDGRIIPEFMRRGFACQDLEVVQGGNSVRTFAYVSDSVEAIFRVLLMGKDRKAYNVGSSEEITMKELAEYYVDLFDGAMKVVMEDQEKFSHLTATPSRTTPDIRKLKQELGFVEKVPLRTGLRRMKEWYEKYGSDAYFARNTN